MRILFLISALFFFLSPPANSQFVGGDITYKRLLPMWSYEIHVTRYTDFPSVNDNSYVTMITPTGPFLRTDSALLCNNILQSTYVTNHYFSGWGTYDFIFTDTLIGNNIINFPNSELFPITVRSVLNDSPFADPQSSVYFAQPPIMLAAKDTILKYNMTAIDSNADSLSFTMVDLDDTASNYWIPSTVHLNQVSGELTWNNPDSIGKYVFGILIKEWRTTIGTMFVGSVLRIVTVDIDTLNASNYFSGISSWSTNGNGDYESHIIPNQNFSVSIVYTDTLADSTSLSAYSELFFINNPSTFISYSIPNGKIGYFTWTPDTANIRNYPYVVTFRGTSFKDTLCISQDITLMIYVDGINSVNNLNNNPAHVMVYPNPAYDNLTIEISTPSSAKNNLSIFNTLGEKIFTENFHEQKHTVNISPFPNGIYFIEVKTEKEIFRKKIIKQ